MVARSEIGGGWDPLGHTPGAVFSAHSRRDSRPTGAKFLLKIFIDMRTRGYRHIPIAVCDRERARRRRRIVRTTHFGHHGDKSQIDRSIPATSSSASSAAVIAM